jgi:hypothetical protein
LTKFKIKIELEKCLKLKVVQKRKVFKFQIFLKAEKNYKTTKKSKKTRRYQRKMAEKRKTQ